VRDGEGRLWIGRENANGEEIKLERRQRYIFRERKSANLKISART
jgi:hypothetical protein